MYLGTLCTCSTMYGYTMYITCISTKLLSLSSVSRLSLSSPTLTVQAVRLTPHSARCALRASALCVCVWCVRALLSRDLASGLRTGEIDVEIDPSPATTWWYMYVRCYIVYIFNSSTCASHGSWIFFTHVARGVCSPDELFTGCALTNR